MTADGYCALSANALVVDDGVHSSVLGFISRARAPTHASSVFVVASRRLKLAKLKLALAQLVVAGCKLAF